MIEFREDVPVEKLVELHPLMYNEPFPLESYQRKKESGKHLANIGFFQGETILGYCVVIDFPEEKRYHAWVGGTLPEYQAKGVFSQFYDWLIQQAARQGYQFVTGNTDNYKPNMLRLMIRKGFDIIGVDKTQHGDGTKVLLRYTVHKPIRLRLSITNACNFNCFFCHHDGVVIPQTVKLAIPQLERILIQAKKSCLEELTITGGEPAVCLPAVEYILRYCGSWDHPPRIKIATNGVLWSEERIKILKRYPGKIKLNISFHSAREAQFGQIYGCSIPRETYDLLFRNLRAQGIECRLNVTVLRGINSSPRAMRELLCYADEKGITAVNFMELLLTRKQTGLFAYYCPQNEIVQNLLAGADGMYQCRLAEQTRKKTIYEVTGEHGTIRAAVYRLSCRAGCENCLKENDITIGADGRGHPCYIDSAVCCGSALDSLDEMITQCEAYVRHQPEGYSMHQLYWGNQHEASV